MEILILFISVNTSAWILFFNLLIPINSSDLTQNCSTQPEKKQKVKHLLWLCSWKVDHRKD